MDLLDLEFPVLKCLVVQTNDNCLVWEEEPIFFKCLIVLTNDSCLVGVFYV